MPINPADHDLLTIIVNLHAERGPIARDALSVVARGRGLEFGRALLRLKASSLVEETERRPTLLMRLLGAQSVVYLYSTDTGAALIRADGSQGGVKSGHMTVVSPHAGEAPMTRVPKVAPVKRAPDATVTRAAVLPGFLRTNSRRLTPPTTHHASCAPLE